MPESKTAGRNAQTAAQRREALRREVKRSIPAKSPARPAQ